MTFYNGNIIDNRLSNLRKATKSDNAHNKIHKNSTGHKGIRFDKRINKYRGILSKNYKNYCTKYYENIEDAVIAYKELDKKIYGEFAS